MLVYGPRRPDLHATRAVQGGLQARPAVRVGGGRGARLACSPGAWHGQQLQRPNCQAGERMGWVWGRCVCTRSRGPTHRPPRLPGTPSPRAGGGGGGCAHRPAARALCCSHGWSRASSTADGRLQVRGMVAGRRGGVQTSSILCCAAQQGPGIRRGRPLPVAPSIGPACRPTTACGMAGCQPRAGPLADNKALKNVSAACMQWRAGAGWGRRGVHH